MNENAQKGLEEYRRKLKAGLIVKKNPLEKAICNPGSLRKAVDAKCWDCCGAENWRNRTRFCAIFECGLWNVRPGGKGVNKEQCRAWKEPSV